VRIVQGASLYTDAPRPGDDETDFGGFDDPHDGCGEGITGRGNVQREAEATGAGAQAFEVSVDAQEA
jgi:hypothetical protein